jgi:hypothetical protein
MSKKSVFSMAAKSRRNTNVSVLPNTNNAVLFDQKAQNSVSHDRQIIKQKY